MSASKLKPYQTYKKSNTWIHEFPEHWKLKRIKHLFRIHNGATPKSGNPAFWNGEINWVTPDDLGSLEGIEIDETSRKITAEGYASCGTSNAKAGSIAISTRAPIGHLAITKRDMSCNQGCRLLEPKMDTDIIYFHAFLETSIKELQSWGQGSTFKELPRHRLESLPVLLPPPEELKVITDFLQLKRKNISELIDNLKHNLLRLEEKRSALITQAVTKGINPNVPMKDSGIEWLGIIPEHWNVSRLKFHAEIKGRIGFRGYTVSDLVEPGEGALTLGATHISASGDIDLSNPVYISWEKYFESPEIMISKGDILIVQRGSCGKIGYVSDDLGPATINPSLAIVKNISFNRDFMNYFLKSNGIEKLLDSIQGTTAVPMISQEQIGEIPICIPPSEEIKQIIQYLNLKTHQIGKRKSMLMQKINQLNEYRTALISALVTGKVDVRSL